MAAAVELPHLEGDLAALVVGLGRLIPLVQLADLVVDRRWGELVGTQRTQRRSSARYQSLMCVQVGRQGGTAAPKRTGGLRWRAGCVACQPARLLCREPGRRGRHDYRGWSPARPGSWAAACRCAAIWASHPVQIRAVWRFCCRARRADACVCARPELLGHEHLRTFTLWFIDTLTWPPVDRSAAVGRHRPAIMDLSGCTHPRLLAIR